MFSNSAAVITQLVERGVTDGKVALVSDLIPNLEMCRLFS